jgi:[ribosomal protein S5]-alanine N-acetyltransferase
MAMQFVLETPRLLLRPMLDTDDQGMFDLDSRPEVLRYLGIPPFTNIAQSQALIHHVQKQYAEHGIGRFAVEWKATGEFVGWAGLKFNTEPLNGQVNYYDLGYRLLPKFWGLGIATEASIASLDLAFGQLNAPCVFAGVLPDNLASVKVLEKLGLQFVNQFELLNLNWHWYVLEKP